jgi:hypothetical protein
VQGVTLHSKEENHGADDYRQ